MVSKVESEAEPDATEKAFCDKELAETNLKKDDKTSEIEKLSAKIEKQKSQSANFKEQVATLQAELVQLTCQGDVRETSGGVTGSRKRHGRSRTSRGKVTGRVTEMSGKCQGVSGSPISSNSGNSGRQRRDIAGNCEENA